MDLQTKTKRMIDTATTKGLGQLKRFKEVYAQFPKENKGDLKDLAEEWLFKNGTPGIQPSCVKCKAPAPYSVPLVLVNRMGEVEILDDSFFRDHYFNDSVNYRICLRCGQTHPKIV